MFFFSKSIVWIITLSTMQFRLPTTNLDPSMCEPPRTLLYCFVWSSMRKQCKLYEAKIINVAQGPINRQLYFTVRRLCLMWFTKVLAATHRLIFARWLDCQQLASTVMDHTVTGIAGHIITWANKGIELALEKGYEGAILQPVRWAGGWWLVLVCSERKVLLAGGWWAKRTGCRVVAALWRP
jgi:hypothetical protein